MWTEEFEAMAAHVHLLLVAAPIEEAIRALVNALVAVVSADGASW